MQINIKKYIFKNKLKNKKNNNNQLNIKKKYTYYPIFWKKTKEFYMTVSFNAYQSKLWWLKKKFNNIKYHKIITLLRDKNTKISFKKPFLFKHFRSLRLNYIINFLYLYNYFFNSIYIDLFYLTKYLQIKKKNLLYFLIMSFKKNRMFLNLNNFSKKNFFFLSTGLFIKFFEKKKSFKKNKTIKLLMAKYVRKIFLISKIKNTVLIIKRNPIFLLEIINFFNLPIVHKFLNPIENKIIEEEDNNFIKIKFLYFIFLENKNFSKNKQPQKGRIKRKILRKIVFENKIID